MDPPGGFCASCSPQLELICRQLSELARMVEHHSPPAISTDGVSEARIRRIQRSRQLRTRYFDPHLFSDPMWDMLLELYANHIANAPISVTSLCIASGAPATTGLRRLDDLAREGFIERQPDPKDGRRIMISLSDAGVQRMGRYFGSLPEADVI